MRKILPLSLALGALSFTPAVMPAHAADPAKPAAPATGNAAAPAPIAAPALRPEAVAYLDTVTATYKALNGLSANFVATEVRSEAQDVTRGSLSFQRPDKVRLQGSISDGDFAFVLNGTNFTLMTPAKEYRKLPVPAGENIGRVLGTMPSATAMFLQLFLEGTNPAKSGEASNFSSVEILPATAAGTPQAGLKGVSLQVPASQRFKSLKFNLYFNPETNLLERGEAFASTPNGDFSNLTEFSAQVTNPTFAADAFQFVPPPGVKEVKDPAAPAAPAPGAPKAATPANSPVYWDPALKVGGNPLPVSGKDLSGLPKSLANFKGKVLLVDFWATWCGPCVAELPNLKRVYNRYHKDGLEILGVSLDEEKSELYSFVRSNQVYWTNLWDGLNFNGTNPKRYKLEGIPFTLLIGRDGKIAAINPRGEQLEAAVAKALETKTPTPPVNNTPKAAPAKAAPAKATRPKTKSPKTSPANTGARPVAPKAPAKR